MFALTQMESSKAASWKGFPGIWDGNGLPRSARLRVRGRRSARVRCDGCPPLLGEAVLLRWAPRPVGDGPGQQSVAQETIESCPEVSGPVGVASGLHQCLGRNGPVETHFLKHGALPG